MTDLGLSELEQLNLVNDAGGIRALPYSIFSQALHLQGGPIELEQMGSADTPLAVHGFYARRHYQHRRHRAEEVHELDGPIGSGPAGIAVFHWSVLVHPAVCWQAAQRAAQ